MNNSSEAPRCISNEEKRMDDQTPTNSVSNVSKEALVWTAGPADVNVPETVQCEQQLNTFRHQSQPNQDQPYPDYLVYPQYQQFALLNSSVTGAQGNGQSSSTWFSSEPILCSMMPGEVPPSEANLSVPFRMDHQQFQEGSVDGNHLTHPYYENQSAQVVLMNPEPGPVFVTLENASLHRNNSFSHEEVVTTLPHGCDADPELDLIYASQTASSNCTDVLGLESHNQVACPSVSEEQTADRQRQASASQAVRKSREPRSRKPCHCTKSKCLKLYCECFSNGVMCNNCNCTDCHNNPENEAKRGKAMKSCLVRNPNAFRPKISGGKSGDVKGWHCKGCNCKRSGCLKNYCECYEANIRCTPACKCAGCRNYDVNLMDWNLSVKDQTPTSVITSAVVETVTGCLLARAAEAEREQHSEALAQQEVLDEFGHCFAQIIKAMFNKIHLLMEVYAQVPMSSSKQDSCQAKQGGRIECVTDVPDKSSWNRGCAHFTALAPAAHTTTSMRLRATVVWTLTVIISLFVELDNAHKIKIHWGPQSMMYLKGKHGRRFVSEEDSRILKQGLHNWYTLLKGVHGLQLVDFIKPRHIVSSEKVLIQYLQER